MLRPVISVTSDRFIMKAQRIINGVAIFPFSLHTVSGPARLVSLVSYRLGNKTIYNQGQPVSAWSNQNRAQHRPSLMTSAGGHSPSGAYVTAVVGSARPGSVVAVFRWFRPHYSLSYLTSLGSVCTCNECGSVNSV